MGEGGVGGGGGWHDAGSEFKPECDPEAINTLYFLRRLMGGRKSRERLRSPGNQVSHLSENVQTLEKQEHSRCSGWSIPDTYTKADHF